MAAVETKHWWFCARREVISAAIASLALSKTAKITEIGCGTGGNLRALSRFGSVTGVEPFATARDIASQKSGMTVLPGALPDGLPPAAYDSDLIVLLDVLEHIEDESGALRAVYKALKPKGLLLVTVPAWRNMWSPHDELLHHKRRYERGELKTSLKQAGFGVLRNEYFNTLLMPAILLQRAIKKALKISSTDDAMPASPVNALFSAVMKAERMLARYIRLPTGVSEIAIAQRP